MSQNLHDALRDLADEVRLVDLRDRSVQTSRQMTRRYIIAGVASVVVAVAAVTTGALALRPSASGPPVQPAQSETPTAGPTATPRSLGTFNVTFRVGLDQGRYIVQADLEYQEPGKPSSFVSLTAPDKIELTNSPGTVLMVQGFERLPVGGVSHTAYHADVAQDSHYDFNLVVGGDSQLATVPAPDGFTNVRYDGNTADPAVPLTITAHWNGPTATPSWNIGDGYRVDFVTSTLSSGCPSLTVPASGPDPGKLDLTPPKPNNSAATCHYQIILDRAKSTALGGTLKVKSGTLIQEDTLNILYVVGP
jgi:hypothetical protein